MGKKKKKKKKKNEKKKKKHRSIFEGIFHHYSNYS